VDVNPAGIDVHEYVTVPVLPRAKAVKWVVSPTQSLAGVAEAATEKGTTNEKDPILVFHPDPELDV
jgi:hypothetical protein